MILITFMLTLTRSLSNIGVFASENLIRVLTTNSHWIEYANLPNNKQKSKNVELIKKALIEAYQKIDHELNISDQVQYGIDVSGCTAVTCIITPTHIVCASLGDSRYDMNRLFIHQ